MKGKSKIIAELIKERDEARKANFKKEIENMKLREQLRKLKKNSNHTF